ncbi:DNA ligase [Paenibacillus marinisediminis]
MNITSMVRGMMGDAKPGETRVLELKTGQQVRGIVQSVSENGKEAVVQINGVAVHAVLETPLQQGQATWMVVEGQQEDGMIMLKPSDGPNAQPLPTLADALKQAGLPDEPWARTLVLELQKNGIPLTRDTMERLGKAMQQKPPGVSLEQWMQAVAVAVKRQLPLTAAGISGLQQAMFGKPLNELLTAFLKAGDTLQGGSIANTAWSGVLKESQALVRTLLALMPSAGGTAEGSGAGTGTASAGAGAGGLSQGGQAMPGGSTANAQAQGGAAGGSGAAAGAANAGQGSVPSTGAGAAGGAGASVLSPGGQAMPDGGTANAHAQGGAAGGSGAAAGAASAGQGSAPSAGAGAAGGAANAAPAQPSAGAQAPPVSGGAASVQPQQAASAHDAGAPAPSAPATHAGGMIGRLLTLLGVSHEHGVQRALLQGSAAAPPAQAAATARLAWDGSINTSQAQQAQAAPQGGALAQESLKSALLQLLQSDSLPPAIRESAQSIVQQITGQQLLLASDRSQPFAHVTLFVPFVTPDGQQTAAVHVQARQGRKGELDAGNCRLWFDLELKSLGRTLVDVNVVEKLVALNIHHPDEDIQDKLRLFRGEIEAGLERIGYQMSAYRLLDLPKKEECFEQAERIMKDYTSESYKGVDLRI